MTTGEDDDLVADESPSAPARRPTIKHVAARAGVSFKTVSRVMNGDTHVNEGMREAVEAAMAALDYRPHRAARALRSSRTFAIALLAGSQAVPAEGERTEFPEYLGEVIAGCARACRPAGSPPDDQGRRARSRGLVQNRQPRDESRPAGQS